MSKLRADITWNNRSKSDSLPIPLNNEIDNHKNDIDNNNKNMKEAENIENVFSKEELEEDDLVNLEDSNNLEEEFGKYLEGWAEILEDEIFSNFDNDDDDKIVSVNDIIHPAIDPDAKWNLRSLFKELEMPF